MTQFDAGGVCPSARPMFSWPYLRIADYEKTKERRRKPTVMLCYCGTHRDMFGSLSYTEWRTLPCLFQDVLSLQGILAKPTANTQQICCKYAT